MESWVSAIQSKQGKYSGGRRGSTILALNGGLPTFCFHDRVAFFYSKEGLTGSNQKLRQLCSQGATRRGTKKHAHTHDFGRFNGLPFMRIVRKAMCLKGNSKWKYLFWTSHFILEQQAQCWHLTTSRNDTWVATQDKKYTSKTGLESWFLLIKINKIHFFF